MEEKIEIWKDVVGYEDYYSISNFGNLYSKRYKRIKKSHLHKTGYPSSTFTVNYISSTKKIHRLVGEAFIPNPDNKPHIDHIDGDKQNNYYLNLRWCTHAENIAFAWATGLYKHIGSKHALAKLNEEKVLSIRKEISEGKKSSDIARKYNISPGCVCDIKKGRHWNRV